MNEKWWVLYNKQIRQLFIGRLPSEYHGNTKWDIHKRADAQQRGLLFHSPHGHPVVSKGDRELLNWTEVMNIFIKTHPREDKRNYIGMFLSTPDGDVPLTVFNQHKYLEQFIEKK